jgi:hypothetical protein
MSTKYEQLIEYIINEEEDKAKELFHDIVVQTSRDIYENLIDEDDFSEEETVDDMSDAIEADEEGISEEDDEMDMDMDDEEESEESEPEIEDRVMDLEDALDELKAEFDAMLDDDGDKEPEMDMELDMGDMGDQEEQEESVEEHEVVREYVDKVAQPANNSEAVTSPVAGKNDMGGKAVDPTGEENGGSTPKVAPGKSYKNTAGGKAPLERASAAKTGE